MARRLLVILPQPAVGPLTPLFAAWTAGGVEWELVLWDGEPPIVSEVISRHLRPLDAALLIGPPRRSPSTMVPGPFVLNSAGRRVPVAWLPFMGADALAKFAVGAAAVHARAASEPAAALLAQWMPHYLRVTDRMQVILEGAGASAFRWAGDALTRDDMLEAVQSGLGLAFYVGHGRPVGWVGYHGVRAHHFEPTDEPVGAMVSLCCLTASRKRTALSYAEALPLSGAAGASFGAVLETKTTDNTRWAVGFCRALVGGAETLSELILAAAPASPDALDAYRIIGDPLIPIRSSPLALQRAHAVRTYE